MATPDFVLKAGDTGPAISAVLTDGDGAVVPLTGASARFHLKPITGAPAVVDQVAEIVDAAAGSVRYAWRAGDTDLAASYAAEWEVTFADGTVETFPNDRYLTVVIAERLA